MGKTAHRGQAMTTTDAKQASVASVGRTRMCAVSRKRLDEEHLLRFVVAPDGRLLPDVNNKLPGRGVWIEATEETVRKAVKTNAFARGLKRKPAEIDAGPLDELLQQINGQLRKSALGALGLAKKAGQIVVSADRIRQVMETDDLILIIHASDASEGGSEKIDQKFRHFVRNENEMPVLADIFDSDEMTLALGHTNVVHAALMEGGASRMVLKQIRRLLRFKGKATGNAVAQGQEQAPRAEDQPDGGASVI